MLRFRESVIELSMPKTLLLRGEILANSKD